MVHLLPAKDDIPRDASTIDQVELIEKVSSIMIIQFTAYAINCML